MRQLEDDPLSETVVHVESLIYSDGSVNDTANHQLEIHVAAPDEDYHEWQNRYYYYYYIINLVIIIYLLLIMIYYIYLKTDAPVRARCTTLSK